MNKNVHFNTKESSIEDLEKSKMRDIKCKKNKWTKWMASPLLRQNTKIKSSLEKKECVSAYCSRDLRVHMTRTFDNKRQAW